MKTIPLFITVICSLQLALGQNKVVFHENFDNSKIQEVVISNIFGGITIEGTTSDNIEIQATLKDGSIPKDMSIDFKQSGDYLLVYLRTPCTSEKSSLAFNPENPLNIGNCFNNCNWNNGNDLKLPTLNFSIKVPVSKNTYVSTVNEGDINISKVEGKVLANNVNGSITLDEVSKVLEARTINGNVIVNYSKAPTLDAKFHTINGNIKTNFPEAINANSSFKTMHGDFYTDLKDFTMLSKSLISEDNNEGFKYKIDNRQRMQFGKGGVQLDFETLNGDAYITLNK